MAVVWVCRCVASLLGNDQVEIQIVKIASRRQRSFQSIIEKIDLVALIENLLCISRKTELGLLSWVKSPLSQPMRIVTPFEDRPSRE